jgi:hypothetical protein
VQTRGHARRAQPPPAQPPGPSRAQPGAGRASWSWVSRAAAWRALRCAAVSQTRAATRVPVSASVWHVTFESAFAAFVETLAAVARTVVACVAAPAPAAGAFTVDAWLGETDAQAHSRTLVSRVVGKIGVEAWKDGIRLLGEGATGKAGRPVPSWVLEVGREGDKELAAQLIVHGVRIGTPRLNGDRNHRWILVGDVVDAAADLEVVQHMIGERQVDVAV